MKSKTKWEGHARLIALARQKARDHEKHEAFTPELQARRRSRSNIPFIPRRVDFNTQASKDGIRHFAEGIGDSNPLFVDEEYGKKSKFGCNIASPAYLYAVKWGCPGAQAPGVHAWYVGGDWEWYRPIFAGDEFRLVGVLRDLVEKQGKMGGGRTWFDYGDVIYINQKGEIVGKELGHTAMAERAASKSAAKYSGIPKPVYDRDDWIRILDMYEAEELRGSEPRYWEDVKIGDTVGPMIKGPLSVRDEVAWLIGAGTQFMRAHKLEYQYEARHPRMLEYVDTEEADTPGDVPELVHFLNAYAKTIGIERAYDYGSQRMSWLCNIFTNWMGDDAFLWKMSGDMRVFNMVGDITTFEGKVVKRYIDDGKCCVDIEAWAKNQRDEWSITPAISTVVLPSREHGPVKYPEPTLYLVEEVQKARPLDDLIEEGILV